MCRKAKRKIERKERKKIQKGSLGQKMCRIVKSKKGKVTMTWLKPDGCVKQSPSWLPTKSLCSHLFRIKPKRKEGKNRKGKG